MLPTFTCLFSLTHKRSAGSSFTPRWSSIRSRSLPRRETPPPGRSVFPKRNTAIHDSTPVVRAALPGLHGGNLNRAPAVTREGRGGEKKKKKHGPNLLAPTAGNGMGESTRKTLRSGRGHPGIVLGLGRRPRAGPTKKPRGSPQRRRRADPKDTEAVGQQPYRSPSRGDLTERLSNTHRFHELTASGR